MNNIKKTMSKALFIFLVLLIVTPYSLFAKQPPKATPINEQTLQPVVSNQQQGGSRSSGAAGAATSIGSCIGASGLTGLVQNMISSLLGGLLGGSVPINDAVGQGKESGILGMISWDQLGWCLANSAIEQIGNATVAWINSGFEGNPVFIEDPEQFFTDLADAQAGAFFQELGGGFLCEPLQNIVRVNLAQTYNGQISQYSDRSQCSFSSVAGNFEQFTSGQSFSWDDWFSYTQVPQNNEMGATIFGQIELDRRVTGLLGLEKNKLDWSGGFFSIKDKETGKITTPGKIAEDQINQKLFSGQKRLEIADEFNEVISALVTQLINTAIGSIMQGGASSSSYSGGRGFVDDGVSAETYTVTFNENGGFGTMSPQILTEGEPQSLRSNQFIRSNFNFLGWNTSVNGSGTAYANGAQFTIESDITLYAQWTDKDVHNITISSLGRGNVRSVPSGIRCGNNCIASFEAGTEVTLTATPDEKFIFAGWRGGICNDETGPCKITMSQSRSITATFTENTLNVSFDANGASGGTSIQIFTEGQTKPLLANTLTRSGYEFAGWAISATGPVVYADRASFTMDNSSTTLYAKWVPAKHSVNFVPNGASSGSMTPIADVTSGEGLTLPQNTYVRTRHAFLGWATSATGPVVYKDEERISNITSSMTLYAVWQEVFAVGDTN